MFYHRYVIDIAPYHGCNRLEYMAIPSACRHTRFDGHAAGMPPKYMLQMSVLLQHKTEHGPAAQQTLSQSQNWNFMVGYLVNLLVRL